MPIYTGHTEFRYRCPYCGNYATNRKTIMLHMGKIMNMPAHCPQLQIGVLEQGVVKFKDAGKMEIFDV